MFLFNGDAVDVFFFTEFDLISFLFDFSWARRQAEQPLQIPEGVPRLYDLIRVKDERVKPAFYYTLRNTLVADNLEQVGTFLVPSSVSFH